MSQSPGRRCWAVKWRSCEGSPLPLRFPLVGCSDIALLSREKLDMAQQRQHKVGHLLREEISTVIQRELRDPRIGLVSITEVSVSPDLRQAKIFVSIYGDRESKKANIEALNSAAGHIRAILSRRLEIHHVPDLEFALDDSLERGARVFELLERVRREQPEEEQ